MAKRKKKKSKAMYGLLALAMAPHLIQAFQNRGKIANWFGLGADGDAPDNIKKSLPGADMSVADFNAMMNRNQRIDQEFLQGAVSEDLSPFGVSEEVPGYDPNPPYREPVPTQGDVDTFIANNPEVAMKHQIAPRSIMMGDYNQQPSSMGKMLGDTDWWLEGKDLIGDENNPWDIGRGGQNIAARGSDWLTGKLSGSTDVDREMADYMSNRPSPMDYGSSVGDAAIPMRPEDADESLNFENYQSNMLNSGQAMSNQLLQKAMLNQMNQSFDQSDANNRLQNIYSRYRK